MNNNAEKKTNPQPLAISTSGNDKVALIYSVKVRTVRILNPTEKAKK